MGRDGRGGGRRAVSVVVLVTLLIWHGWAGTEMAHAADGQLGDIALTYSYGEVVQDDEGTYSVDPTAALSLKASRRLWTASQGRPDVSCEAYGTISSSSTQRAGLSLGADWPPAEGASPGRQYSLNASLADRWAAGWSGTPEQSWEVGASVRDRGPGSANLEAGGRASAHLNRLSGRDYWETGGYLATRFVVDEEPGLFSWVAPDWLGGLASLLTPPPEPGSEERLDLPAWFEAAALTDLPSLPAVATAPAAGLPARLTITTQHTQTARTYAGDSGSNWEAGVTRLEAREERPWGEVSATYSHTLKLYPADDAETYELSEGEVEISGPLRAGKGRMAAGFRGRRQWVEGGEAYRQANLRLGWDQPARSLTWRVNADWQGRWYSAGATDDYTRAELETGVVRPAGRPGGPSASVVVALSHKDFLSATPDEYRLRLRLAGELHPASGQTLSAALAWERPATVPPGGGKLAYGPTETLLRLSWTKSF